MRLTLVAVSLGLVVAGRVEAQSEEVLRRFFEGKSVVVKMEMPGSEDGVDVYPGTSMPIDFPKHASRLKRYGTSVRRGDEVLITKVKVKKDLVEFQLGGGGYGTFGDETSSGVSVSPAAKTTREKNLEKEVPRMNDPAARKRAQEELDGLRRSREREDASNRAAVAQAEQVKEANIRVRRLDSGSRFNLRYKPVVPEEILSPDGVMRALGEYVDFGPVLAATTDRPGIYGEKPSSGPHPDAQGQLRKGMLLEDVDALLGRPETIGQRAEGTLKVSTSIYLTRDRRIEAEFVEGVLIRFTVSSR